MPLERLVLDYRSGELLDLYPAGPILSLNGAKALISWDRLALVELEED